MLTEKEQQLSEILLSLATEIDITPSKYIQAVERYNAVGTYLEGGTYPESQGTPAVYPQGSFRLGTVVKPIKGGKEAEYDIDLVCQLVIDKKNVSATSLKNMVGDRLKENGKYKGMLKPEEGKRCWTLQYAEQDDVGFHIDILPSIPAGDSIRRVLNERLIPERYFKYAIELTEYDKISKIHSWKDGGSNPEGYAVWFDDRKTCYTDYAKLSLHQKTAIFENTLDQRQRRIFASVNEVPDQLVRTPLQRAIQILKRHRDLHFINDPENKPISIIITTLCARFFENEQDIYSAVTKIVNRIYAFARYLGPTIKYSENVRELQEIYGINPAITSTINKPMYKIGGQWWIPNPVNPGENFADRWDRKKADGFFQWIGKLKNDFDHATSLSNSIDINKYIFPLLGKNYIINQKPTFNIVEKREKKPTRVEIQDPVKPWGL